MRPAYRYSVAVAVLVVLLAGAAATIGWPSSSPPEATATPVPARPRPAPTPEGAAPELPRALDRLQADEAAALGPERAAARRRQREQLIRERGGALPDPAPAPGAAEVPAP